MEDEFLRSADYCRARAEDSERMAAEAQDPTNKAIFRDLADRWRRLAEESGGVALKPVGARLERRHEASGPGL